MPGLERYSFDRGWTQPQFPDPDPPGHVTDAQIEQAREELEAAHTLLGMMTAELSRAVRLLGEVASPEPCRIDHHGGCQAHGYLLLEGKPCPNAQAQEILARYAPVGEPCG